jgi:ribonuclease VapC
VCIEGRCTAQQSQGTQSFAPSSIPRYGKGRNRAALNIADCLSYACAKVHGARLLFKGGDFAHTDIAKA